MKSDAMLKQLQQHALPTDTWLVCKPRGANVVETSWRQECILANLTGDITSRDPLSLLVAYESGALDALLFVDNDRDEDAERI